MANNIKKKRKKKGTDEVVRKAFKRSSGFMFSLLVNIIIVFCVVKVFTFSFNFVYTVFGNAALDPGSKEYKVIEIKADSSALQIGEALEEGGIIEDKYVFFAKVKVKGYGNKIVAGNYGLSPAMTYGEILDIICHIEDKNEEKDEE